MTTPKATNQDLKAAIELILDADDTKVFTLEELTDAVYDQFHMYYSRNWVMTHVKVMFTEGTAWCWKVDNITGGQEWRISADLPY